MPKIKVKIEVPSGEYCENENTTCPMCFERGFIGCCCALFNVELESDNKNHYYCKRCDECKRAEVKDEKEL